MVLTYVDSSVVLAHLFREPRAPPPAFWRETMISSRLLEYEVWNRLHAHGRADTHGERTRGLLAGIELVELSGRTLARALEPFPVAVRTLDGLHLATMDFLRPRERLEFASYDNRLIAAAQALGIPIAAL